MDKRKIYGSILGIIFFIGIIVSLTYARYVWKSEDTMLTFNISDSYFYCESGISSEISELAPVLDYRAGSYQTFKVNNIGRQDTTFSVSLNITAIDESLISGALKYKLMVDKTGGSNNCADTTNSNCVEVEGGSGDFASAKVGMNTLAKVVTIPNNAKYQYYLFIYIDGNMENDLSMQNSSMTAILDVCEIVVFLDYNGGTGEKEFLKVTSNYTGLPTTAEREDTTVTYDTNGGSTVSSDSISYEFGGWYFDTAFANKVTASTTVTSTINHTLYAKWTANKSLTLPTPTKTGYTFAGWYSDEGLTNKVGDAGTSYDPNTDKSSITLYAKWEAQAYNISYTLNGGTAGSNHPATATYDKVITVDNPTRTDYTFQGWTSSTINTSTAKYGTSSSAVTTAWDGTAVTAKYFKNLTATKGATVTLIANWKDAKAPVCTISTPTAIVYGNTTTVTVECTDNDAMSSQTLSTSNFTSSDTTVATIKSVSSPTAITGGYKYTVTITGVKAGTYTISLNAGAIKDNAENKNVKVTSGTGTISSDTKTGTFYYYDGSKIAVATATCSKSSSSSECTYTVPNEVSSSTGRYGSTYRGVASNLSTTTTTTPTSAKQVFYAIYSKAVSIHYPTSTSECSTTAYTGYRNEWFTSTSAMTQVIGSSNTATTNITTISGILGTLKGLASTANTTSYQTVEASAATTTTTFYAVSTSSVTATFYYSTLSTSDETYTDGTQTSTTASGTRTNYCTSTSAATVAHGNITVPTAVSGSNGGQAASNYAGVSKSKSSATLITPTTANTTYYAVYTEDLTFYYYNGSSNTTTKLTRYMLSNGTSYEVSLSDDEPTPSSYNGASYYAWSYQSGSSSSSHIREPLSTGENSLYAIYKKTITISYNANGGSGAPSSQTGTKYYTNNSSNGITETNPSITLSSTKPTMTGYAFSVWKDGSGTSYNANTAYTFSADTELAAQWTPISYNIAYTLNNGNSGSSAPTSATYDTVVNISNPTKTVTVTGDANSSGATVGPATSNTFDFAGWTASNLNTSTAKFGTNSSNVTSSWSSGSTKVTDEYFKNLTATSGATVTLTANWTAKAITTPTLSKTGYTCKWNTKADGSGTSYNAGASFTPTANTANITLYARCTVNSYKIAYELNNGNSGSSAPTSADYNTVVNISNPTKSVTITYDDNSTEATISETAVKQIYTFAGWTASNLATSTAKYGASSSNVNTLWSNASTKVTDEYFQYLNPTSGATVTLTANWTVAAVTLPTVTKTGYTCSLNTKADGSGTSYASGGSYTPDPNGGNVTLYARCTANQYTLTVNPNGGSYNSTTSNSTFTQGYGTTKEIAVPTAPTGYKVTMNPNGGTISTAVETSTYTFNGWTKTGEGSITTNTPVATSKQTYTFGAGNGTLTAGYKHNAVTLGTPDRTYTVTYNSNSTGATIGTASTNVVYTFNGWYTATSGGTKVGEGGASYTPTAATTLYAQWTSKSTTLTTLSKTGHTCNWNTASDGSGTSYSAGATYTPTANVTLYAVCTGNQYTVSFNAGYEGDSGENLFYGYSDGIYELIDFDYQVEGNDISLTSKKDLAGGVTEFAVDLVEGVEYHFTCSSNSSNVGYYLEPFDVFMDSCDYTFTSTVSGKVYLGFLISTQGTYTISDISITANAPVITPITVTYGSAYGTLPSITRTGYTFNGWYTAESGGTKITSTSTVSTASNHTLYAQWTVNSITFQYDMNGGTWAGSTDTRLSYSDSLITKNGSTAINVRYYGVDDAFDLANWDNPDAINISRTGYTAVSGAEWKLSDGTTYADTGYAVKISDLCDLATESCTYTFYVNWTKITYTVSYNANGGSGAPASQTKTYGVDLTLSSTKPTRTNYTFLGWSTSSTATSATYSAGGTYTSNASATLYAVWANVKCTTGSTTTYYTSLTAGLNSASTTSATTCTLLNNLNDRVANTKALYNTTVDLNGKTLTGFITNYNVSSTMTIKNGKITSSDEQILGNSGTMYISSGEYSTSAQHLFNNGDSGKLYITGGTFNHTYSGTDGGAAIVNNSDGTPVLRISNATINATSYGVANWGTGSVEIGNTIITKTGTIGVGIFNLSTGTIRVYDSTVNAGSATALLNTSDTSKSPSFVLFDSTITGTVTGRVITFLHVNDWYGEDYVQIGIFNTTVTKCPTWTNENAQDDIQWYTTSSATTSSGQSYLYANVAYSNHNSTSSLYYTDLYNGDTYLARMSWYWNY